MVPESGIQSARRSTPTPARNGDIPRGYRDQFVSFRDIVAFAYPGPKPVVALMELTSKSESTCRRWLKDEVEVPGSVVMLVLAEYLLRFAKRKRR